MNPLKNLLLKNKSFISNTSQLEHGDTFISINSGHKFLNKNDEKINFSNLLFEITKRTLNENKFESNLFFL